MNPLVSILIPLYNSEKYIAETIQSCLNQSYNNIEIIIVDDGSTDNSYKIAKSFENDTIKVYKQENKGACAARNLAFEKSSGDYIQYLDADDILSSNKIESQLACFKQYGNNVITSCKWDRFYNNINEAKFPDRQTYKTYEKSIDWILDSINKNDMGQTSIWLTPRNIIEKTGKWNEKLTINQDGEFFHRVLLNVNSVIFCENAYVYYRSGDKNSITYTTNKRAESLLSSYMLMEQYLLKKEDTERIRRACYKKYLRFIYENYSYKKNLIETAKQRIKNLGFQKLEPYGGKNFKKIAKIIGFENTLKLRKLLLKR
jgi:glycosyltransferase involved in cell wall biosynthesis